MLSIFADMGETSAILQGVFTTGGQRLDKALAEASGLSRERVKALMEEGRVAVGGKTAAQGSAKPEAGTPWRIDVPQAAPAEAVAQDIPLAVVFEDADLIVIDKPAGLVVHPAAGNPDGTLVNALLHHCRGQLSGIGGVARPGIVHRIDKDTSGLLVVAKTDAAHEGLARQFADHSIVRAYLAVCGGQPLPPAGTVRGSIARSSTNRKKMALVEDGRGKHAVTHYRTLQTLDGAALIECRLGNGKNPPRCGFTLRQSAMLYWVIPCTVARLRVFARSLREQVSRDRRFMRPSLASTIPPTVNRYISPAPTPVDMRELIVELGGSI